MSYLLLLTGALIAVYVARRHLDPPVFVASCTGLGASLGVSDLAVSVLLRLYTFQPHLLRVPDRDHALGFLLADLIAVPLLYSSAAALFPRSRLAVVLILSALLTGVEYLFLQMGVFVHHRWQVWYTLVLFVLRFGIATWWVPHLERTGYTPLFRAFLVTLSLVYAWFLWTVAVSGALRLWVIGPGLFPNPMADHGTGAFLYHALPFFAVGGAMFGFRWNQSGRAWLLVAGMLSAYLLLLARGGLWWHSRGWYPVSEGIALTLLLVGIAYLDAWFGAQLRPKVGAG